MQGILIVDKPMDWTSFDVVAKLRGVLGTRKLGHSGTLDPMATGVLPVFCGGASKAVDLQLDHTKAYRAVLKLGARTDTGDVTGTVLETAPVTAGEKELLEVLPQFVGAQMQTPPMYSAVKVGGQPLYKLAREGKTVERKARPIEIYSITYGGSPAENEYVLEVTCSKGTYIRTLLEAAQRLDADVVQGGWQYLYTDGTHGPVQRYPAAVYTGAAAPERFELPGMPWGKVYRRELFAQVRFPAYYTCFEDAIIHFLVFRLAKTVASVPEMVYLWRKNPKGLTATSQHRPAAVQSYWIMEQLAVQDAALGLPHDALYRCTLTLQLSAFCYATVSGLPPETQQAVFRLCCALYAKALPQAGALPRRARWGARALRQQDFGLWCRYGRRFQLL